MKSVLKKQQKHNMKKTLNLLIIILLCTLSKAQTREGLYYNVEKDDLVTVSGDGFSKDKIIIETQDYIQKNRDGECEIVNKNGYSMFCENSPKKTPVGKLFLIGSVNKFEFLRSEQNTMFDRDFDFEFETEMNILQVTKESSNIVFSGGVSGSDFFCVNISGRKVTIYTYKPSCSSKPEIVMNSMVFPAIGAGYNTYTVRKKGNDLILFINTILLVKLKYKDFDKIFGTSNLSYYAGLQPKSVVRFNYNVFSAIRDANRSVLAISNYKKKSVSDSKDELHKQYLFYKNSGDHAKTAEFAYYLSKQEEVSPEQRTKYLQEAEKILKNAEAEKSLWLIYSELAKDFWDAKDTTQTTKYTKEAIKLIRKTHIERDIVNTEFTYDADDNSIKEVYDLMSELYLAGNKPDSALVIIEESNLIGNRVVRGKPEPVPTATTESRSLSENLRKEEIFSKEVDRLYSEIVALNHQPDNLVDKDKLSSLRIEKDVAEDKYLQHIGIIIAQNPELAQYYSDVSSAQKIFTSKKLIPDNTAVIEYLFTDKSINIFYADKDTVIAKSFEQNMDAFEEAVLSYRNYISTGKKAGQIKKLSYGLYQNLLEPVEKLLSDKKYIAVIPTRYIYNLPIQTLCRKEKDSENLKYIIEDYAVFYINSIDDFSKKQSEKLEDKILALGNPDYSLEGAEKEVKQIKKIYSETGVFLNENATELKAKTVTDDYTVVHFATHGFLEPEDFYKSYILLSEDEKDDGKFTMLEIMGCSNYRNIDLVVLSACNTALSRELQKGWVVNPAKIFTDIGVNSVIASLWEVNDIATQQLITNFYENKKKINTIDALRQSQLNLLKNEKLSHPYFWSPFVLLGFPADYLK